MKSLAALLRAWTMAKRAARPVDGPVSAGLRALCESQRTSSAAAAIRGLCTELLDLAGANHTPVPLRPLLTRLAIDFRRVATYRPGRGAASLTATDAGMAIWIHDPAFRRNYRRTRFSIAHELVHALIIKVLGDQELVASLDATPETLAELELVCDLGASQLLMPSRLVRERVRAHGLTPSALLHLYDEFLVSRHALLAGIALVLPRGSVMRWQHLARTAAEPIAWRIVGSYPRYGADPHRPWLPKGATARHLSHDLPNVVAQTRMAFACESLTVTLNKQRWQRAAYGTFIAPRKRGMTKPLFSGMEIADESSPTEVVVFLAERDGDAPWSSRPANPSEENLDA